MKLDTPPMSRTPLTVARRGTGTKATIDMLRTREMPPSPSARPSSAERRRSGGGDE
jgi:hypothetical protein